MKGRFAALALGLALALAAGCRDNQATPGSEPDHADPDDSQHPHQTELDGLLQFENRRRDHTDFKRVPPSDIALGPNPHAIAAVGDGRFVGTLRGANAIALLDDRGKQLFRAPAPRSPADVAVGSDGTIYVSGESDNVIHHFRAIAEPPALTRIGIVPVAEAQTITSIAVSDGGVLFASEEARGRVFSLGGPQPTQIARCHGPIELRTERDYLAVNCLLDHAIELYRIDATGGVRGEPVRIRHKGPIWGMSLAADADALYVALGGVEDRTLDRSDGGFGYIDSFAFVYRVEGKTAERVAMTNLSELGVVTPKWLDLRLGDTASIAVSGYGGDKLARLVWSGPVPAGEPETRVSDFVPGSSRAARSGAGYVVANALLDAWVYVDADGFEVHHVDRATRSPESHVGERLFFTTLMAPWNESEGKRSRFTCETCHYEGYVDGRTHYTGRDDTHATTKPLLGLFNNRPHFTRALDRTMTKMVNNEFKVANKFNGKDPWFALSAAEFPWLSDIERLPDELDPVFLRKSLMTFLMEFSHRPNPAVRNRTELTETERRGAELFRDNCERCHAARLVTDDPVMSVKFEDWEQLVLSEEGPIVWASHEYRRTGVEPYVHEEGARTTSLRRLYKKWPYFTNGSAKSIDDVLNRVGIAGDEFFHGGAPKTAKRLADSDKKALAAFLRLL